MSGTMAMPAVAYLPKVGWNIRAAQRVFLLRIFSAPSTSSKSR